MVGSCCIQGTEKGVCGSSPARSRLTLPTAQVHVRELGWTRGIEEEVRIASVRKATHILPSSVEPLGPRTHHIKNKSTLTIHIRKGPPVVLSMHLILRTPCTPQSQIIAPVATGFDTRGRPLVRRNAATGAARVRLHDRGANIQVSAPSPGSARDPSPAPRSAPV